jgi:hypothetical protein
MDAKENRVQSRRGAALSAPCLFAFNLRGHVLYTADANGFS